MKCYTFFSADLLIWNPIKIKMHAIANLYIKLIKFCKMIRSFQIFLLVPEIEIQSYITRSNMMWDTLYNVCKPPQTCVLCRLGKNKTYYVQSIHDLFQLLYKLSIYIGNRAAAVFWIPAVILLYGSAGLNYYTNDFQLLSTKLQLLSTKLQLISTGFQLLSTGFQLLSTCF